MNAKDAVTKLASGPRVGTTETDSESDDADQAVTERERPEEVDPLPLDAVFELLKNQRRRHTIDYLQELDGEATLSDLAEHVAALENDTTPQALSSDQRKRAYVGLYQCHLPKMDEMNAVEFNRDRGIIELGPNASQLEPYLDMDDDTESKNWPAFYLALSGGALLALGVATAAVGFVGTLAQVVGIVTVAVVVGLSILHYREANESDE